MDRPRDTDLATRLFGAAPERALALMRAAWPAAVGPEVARRTEVVAFDKGVLRVRVAEASWRRSLVRMRRDILVRLRDIAGRTAPHTLAFEEAPLAKGGDEAPVTTARQPLVSALAMTPPALVDAADAITDAALRQQFLASASRYLARFASTPVAPREDSDADRGRPER